MNICSTVAAMMTASGALDLDELAAHVRECDQCGQIMRMAAGMIEDVLAGAALAGPALPETSTPAE